MDAANLSALTRRFWRALLPEIILLLALILVGGLLGWRWGLHYQAMLATQQHWQRLWQATTSSQQDQRIYARWLNTHPDSLQRWHASGWLTPQWMTHWQSTWPAIANAHQLADAHYQFSPPQPCQAHDWMDAAGCPAHATAQIAVSHLRVRMTLPHEAEVLPWLDAMQHYYHGAHILRSCDWEANATHDAVKIVCEWQWVHLPVTLPGVNAVPNPPALATDYFTNAQPAQPLALLQPAPMTPHPSAQFLSDALASTSMRHLEQAP